MAELTEKQQIELLQKENAEHKNTIAKKDQDLAVAADVVTDLKAKLAEKESGVVLFPKVTVGKDSYELTSGPFTWKGKEVTIDILKEDSKLAQELVKEGVGNLVKVTA